MNETWFVEYRLAWIKETVEIFGFINRNHIMKKFGISTPQASYDIQAAMRRWPDLMGYDRSAKRYERPNARVEEAWVAGAEAMRKIALSETDEKLLYLSNRQADKIRNDGIVEGVRVARGRIGELDVPPFQTQ